MFMGEEGAGSVSHWHHVHFCFTVAGPNSLSESLLCHPSLFLNLSEHGWVLPSHHDSLSARRSQAKMASTGVPASSCPWPYVQPAQWCHWVLPGLDDECQSKQRGVELVPCVRAGPQPALWGSELTCTALMSTGEVDCSFMLGQGTQRHTSTINPDSANQETAGRLGGGANKRTHKWRQEVVQSVVVWEQDWGNTSKWMKQKDTQVR